jgi:hypothetical protein
MIFVESRIRPHAINARIQIGIDAEVRAFRRRISGAQHEILHELALDL